MFYRDSHRSATVLSSYAQHTVRLPGEYSLTHTFHYFSNASPTKDIQQRFGISPYGFNVGIACDLTPSWTIQTQVGLFEAAFAYQQSANKVRKKVETIGLLSVGLRKRFIIAAGLSSLQYFFMQADGLLLNTLGSNAYTGAPGLSIGTEFEFLNESRFYICLSSALGLNRIDETTVWLPDAANTNSLRTNRIATNGTHLALKAGYNIPFNRWIKVRRAPFVPVQSPRYYMMSP